MTRYTYLVLRAMDAGASMPEAMEAVSSTALEHPDWDMAERRSLADWWAIEQAPACDSQSHAPQAPGGV